MQADHKADIAEINKNGKLRARKKELKVRLVESEVIEMADRGDGKKMKTLSPDPQERIDYENFFKNNKPDKLHSLSPSKPQNSTEKKKKNSSLPPLSVSNKKA